jgi:hypothetical protein
MVKPNTSPIIESQPGSSICKRNFRTQSPFSCLPCFYLGEDGSLISQLYLSYNCEGHGGAGLDVFVNA